MAEEAKQEKKKVYVETTVISDATALPSKDLVLAGSQFVSREWLESAKVRYELYSSFLVRRESLKGDPDAAARRMAYFKGMMDYQEELRRQGVKFVSLPPRKPEPAMA